MKKAKEKKKPMNKFLAIVVSAAIGTAIMFLMGYAFGDTLLEADTIGEVLGIVLGIAAASYFVTGFIAGLWTRQVGPGVSAAIVVLVVNLIISFTSGGVQANILSILIAVVFALILGSLGGLAGKVLRPSGNKAESETKDQIATLQKQVADLSGGQRNEQQTFDQAMKYVEKELTLGKEKENIVKDFVKQGWSVQSAWDLVTKAEQSIEHYKKGS